MIERNGDLFSTSAGAVAHGVNVDGAMGAGIAVAFRRRWPAMYGAYRAACRSRELAPGGCFTWVTAPLLDLSRITLHPTEEAALKDLLRSGDTTPTGQSRSLLVGLAHFDDTQVDEVLTAIATKDADLLEKVLLPRFADAAGSIDFAPERNGFAAPLSWSPLHRLWDVMVSGKTSDNIELVLNIASQDRPGPHASLSWLDTGAHAAAEAALAAGITTIALPRIGCGIGGLDYDDVARVLLGVEAEAGVEFEVWTL